MPNLDAGGIDLGVPGGFDNGFELFAGDISIAEQGIPIAYTTNGNPAEIYCLNHASTMAPDPHGVVGEGACHHADTKRTGPGPGELPPAEPVLMAPVCHTGGWWGTRSPPADDHTRESV